ncbi:unnamed protein product [Arabidopsis halleri]
MGESSSTHRTPITMSCSTSDLAAAEIGVFWDIVDCPIPKDLCPKSVYVKIKSALEYMGYIGKVSISAILIWIKT